MPLCYSVWTIVVWYYVAALDIPIYIWYQHAIWS